MFCGLNGRTSMPRRVNARAKPASNSDLPTSDPVPCSINARATAPRCARIIEERPVIPIPRFPGEGRDPRRTWIPAFAGNAKETMYGIISKFDALLGFDAVAEGMLDQRHLGHEIGRVDQFGLGVAAGNDDVQIARLLL